MILIDNRGQIIIVDKFARRLKTWLYKIKRRDQKSFFLFFFISQNHVDNKFYIRYKKKKRKKKLIKFDNCTHSESQIGYRRMTNNVSVHKIFFIIIVMYSMYNVLCTQYISNKKMRSAASLRSSKFEYVFRFR